MPRYFLFIEYNGTPFKGWQIQPNDITIQGELKRCIEMLVKHPVLVYGSGRTDAGVHASYQVAHIDLEQEIDEVRFQYRLNSLMIESAQVWDIQRVSDVAHARFDATSRAYEYRIITQRSPLRSHFAWFLNTTLDLKIMNEASDLLKEVNNFQPFSKDNPENIGSEFCKIEYAYWEKRTRNEYVFKIKSDRFLHHMVRYLVGSLYKVGNGTLSLETFKKALYGELPNFVHLKAPAYGLCLSEVNFPYIPTL